MKCSNCDFEGEFKPAQISFYDANAIHYLIKRNHARRTVVCPQCEVSVTYPFRIKLTYLVVAVILFGLLVGGLVYYVNS